MIYGNVFRYIYFSFPYIIVLCIYMYILQTFSSFDHILFHTDCSIYTVYVLFKILYQCFRCTCTNQIMDKNIECRCCQEIPEIVQKNMELVGSEEEGFVTPPTCIVYHPGFSAVCLNKWVLQTAWFQYKQ